MSGNKKTETSSSAPADELMAETLFSMKGLIALVTGGGTGIGLMIAKAMAANGAKVYIVGRREKTLEVTSTQHTDDSHKSSGSIEPLPGDVTSKDELEKLVKTIEEKEGHLNVLVNNAGISGPKSKSPEEDKEGGHKDAAHIKKLLWDQGVDEWSDVYRTNVSAIYFTTVAFLPLLQKGTAKKEGYSSSIINISSMSGLMKQSQNHMAYNSSKAAAVHLTRMMANEFAEIKIRVNTISPGVFPSEMTIKDSDPQEKSDEQNVSKKNDKMDIPAGRAGDVKDMAGAVLLLASRAGLYINGVVLPVDGGFMVTHPSSY